MGKAAMTAVLVAITLAMSGCATSEMIMQPPAAGQTGPGGAKVVENLEARNWGVFLFYWIPVWSGNPGRPNQRDYVVFENRVKEKYMEIMFRNRAKQLKAGEVEDIRVRESSTGFFSLWILWRRSMSATAVAVEKK